MFKYEYNGIETLNRCLGIGRLKAEVNEFIVRLEIYSFILGYYFDSRKKFAKSKELVNIQLYKPQMYIRLFYILMPVYFLHSNLFIFFLFRRTFTLSKYVGIMLFNLISFNLFCLVLDKRIFFDHISRPLPYSKYMREE
jgi:hypothetical protein